MEYKGRTKQEWLEAIEAFTVDSVIAKLVPLVASGEFSFKGDPSYVNLVMKNKPMLDVFEDELAEFKISETIRIQGIFTELEKDAELEARLDAIGEDLINVVRLKGDTSANMTLLKKRIIEERDEALLTELEALLPTAKLVKAKDEGINLALQAIEGGKRIVAYMNALNGAKNPTIAQVKATLQDADLALIKAMLESGSLKTAKEEIEGYTPSGIITEEDKVAILTELNSYLNI